MWIWLLQGEQQEKRREGDKLWLIYMFISKAIQTISLDLCLFPDCNILVIVVLLWVMILLPCSQRCTERERGFFYKYTSVLISSPQHRRPVWPLLGNTGCWGNWGEGRCLMNLICSLCDGEGKVSPGIALSLVRCLSEYHDLSQVAVEGRMPASPAFMFYLKRCLTQRVLLSHWMWSVSAAAPLPLPLGLSPSLFATVFDHLSVCASQCMMMCFSGLIFNKVSIKIHNPFVALWWGLTSTLGASKQRNWVLNLRVN